MDLSVRCSVAPSICELEFSKHTDGDSLKKTINKSLGQRGVVGASHMQFDLNDHLLLKKALNRARELSLKNSRCPYVLSYSPKAKRPSKAKSHYSQVLPDKLGKDFKIVRDATGLFAKLPEGRTPPTFHEIKGLSINEAKKLYSIKQVQEQAAHTDEKVTESYKANHKPTWTKASVIFDEGMIDGSL